MRPGSGRGSDLRASYLKRAPRLAAALAHAAGSADIAETARAARRLVKVSAIAGEVEIAALAAAAQNDARVGDIARAAERAMRITVLVAGLASESGSADQRPMRRA
jgi:hypothetical protein